MSIDNVGTVVLILISAYMLIRLLIRLGRSYVRMIRAGKSGLRSWVQDQAIWDMLEPVREYDARLVGWKVQWLRQQMMKDGRWQRRLE